MLVLGIDPGIATTGFAVVSRDGGRLVAHAYGAITTPAGMPQAARLTKLRTELEELIANHQPGWRCSTTRPSR
jgi:crossover junction endodeoxyribonuclease RuvC